MAQASLWGLLLTLVLPGLSACNNETMTPPSLVVRDRVAGIRAEPPEIPVGGTTTLDALLVHPGPTAPDLGQIWFACVEGGSATSCLSADIESFGEIDSGDTGDLDPSALQFGIGPTFEYEASGPQVEEAWAALDPEDRVEGLSVFVSVAFVQKTNDELFALLTAIGAATQSGDQAALDAAVEEFGSLLDDAIMAARRIIISDKTASEPGSVPCGVDDLLPNANPELGTLLFHLDEEGRDSGFELHNEDQLSPESTAVLRPQLGEGSVEDYLYISQDGETECRTEAPFFAWLSNGGTHQGDYSFIADLEDEDETPGRPKVHSFVTPEESEFTDGLDLWLVVRDRRGGITWRHWTFRPDL